MINFVCQVMHVLISQKYNWQHYYHFLRFLHGWHRCIGLCNRTCKRKNGWRLIKLWAIIGWLKNPTIQDFHIYIQAIIKENTTASPPPSPWFLENQWNNATSMGKQSQQKHYCSWMLGPSGGTPNLGKIQWNSSLSDSYNPIKVMGQVS